MPGRSSDHPSEWADSQTSVEGRRHSLFQIAELQVDRLMMDFPSSFKKICSTTFLQILYVDRGSGDIL